MAKTYAFQWWERYLAIQNRVFLAFLNTYLRCTSLVLFMAVGKRSTAQLSISSQRTLFSQSWHKGLQSTSVAHCRDKEISQLPRKLLTCRCRGDSQKGMGTCSPVVEGNQKETMFLLGVAVKSVWSEESLGSVCCPNQNWECFIASTLTDTLNSFA